MITQNEMRWILKNYNEWCKIASLFKKKTTSKRLKCQITKMNVWKVVHGVITFKDGTLFKLDEDGYYILYIIIYYIILYYIIY